MPALEQVNEATEPQPLTKLPFKPVTKAHILHCSYENWYPKYRSLALKSRLIPLTTAFLDYLREDGLWVPDDEPWQETPWSSEHADKIEDPAFLSPEKPNDVSLFQDIHEKIKNTISEVGNVIPKLNWSAPKDVVHMNQRQNTMVCDKPSHIYLLLKSSMFVEHDLERAFDECAEDGESGGLTLADIPYTLVLRKEQDIDVMFEFRCFVRDRTLVGICQRALKFFDYSPSLIQLIQSRIQAFFDKHLKTSFPDTNFVFDVWLPEPHDKVRLIDINPWAPRTDPILFSWLELLQLPLPQPLLGIPDTADAPDLEHAPSDDDETGDELADEEVPFKPEFRVVQKDDPEAYNISTAPFSAHKMPRDVVYAAEDGPSAAELLNIMNRTMRGEMGVDSDDSDED